MQGLRKSGHRLGYRGGNLLGEAFTELDDFGLQSEEEDSTAQFLLKVVGDHGQRERVRARRHPADLRGIDKADGARRLSEFGGIDEDHVGRKCATDLSGDVLWGGVPQKDEHVRKVELAELLGNAKPRCIIRTKTGPDSDDYVVRREPRLLGLPIRL